MSARRLIVNADDFGFTRDVNAGIVEAHRRGIVTATTLMANAPAFDDAVKQARQNPLLDIGCHLVLVGGPSLAEPGRQLPRTVRHLVWRLARARSPDWIEREIEAQIEKILQAGLRVSHLDTHKHTHLAPPVLEVVCRVSQKYSVSWVRRPFDLPLTGSATAATRAVNSAFRAVRRRFDRTLARYGCRTTDHFAGFEWTGNYGAAELVSLVGCLPEGLTEFMCHPGHCTDELRAASTRLKESRQRELDALLSPAVRTALRDAAIETVSFADV